MQLGTVEVTAEKKDENITRTQMGVEKIDMKEIEKIPVLFGEKDILKTIQLRPGVKSAGEGNSGFYVRGGAADQNLILLDEATVYNASHLLGFFSVFNSDALKDVTLYKGGMPSEYGGRLSSVLDIRMKDGNDKKFGMEGGIGLIASRLKLEGPIVKEKGSFTISGRRTYADLFLKLSPDTSTRQAKLFFYDLNAKANYRINDKNRIFLSGYFGKDVLGFGEIFGFDWGNATGTLRWNHIVNNKMFSNTSLIYSNYNYNINLNFGGTDSSGGGETINFVLRARNCVFDGYSQKVFSKGTVLSGVSFTAVTGTTLANCFKQDHRLSDKSVVDISGSVYPAAGKYSITVIDNDNFRINIGTQTWQSNTVTVKMVYGPENGYAAISSVFDTDDHEIALIWMENCTFQNYWQHSISLARETTSATGYNVKVVHIEGL